MILLGCVSYEFQDEKVRLGNDHSSLYSLFTACLILWVMSYPLYSQEFLGPYIDQWDSLNQTSLDDVVWERPQRLIHEDGRVRVHLKGRSDHFRSMSLTPVVMVASHDRPKIFRSEEARILLVQDIPFEVTENGYFQLGFDLMPGLYRFHLTFETLARERLSYLILLHVNQQQAIFQRFIKTTHNIGVDRFLTYEELLERADHQAYVQTEDVEARIKARYKTRRRNNISVGLGASLMSFSQTTEELNKRINTTNPHLPLLALGFDYNFGRDFFVLGELRHHFINTPTVEPLNLSSNQGYSWSSQFLHAHYILPFWGRRIDVIAGFHRTRIPYFNRVTEKVVEVEKNSFITSVLGLKGRWLLTNKSEMHLQFLLRPVLFGGSEALSSQTYYGLGFMLVHNLNANWSIGLDGGFDKYSADRLLTDGVDAKVYLSKQSLVQTYLLLKFARQF
jgi:hypothetical protein